jgi:hypothetical protein
MVSVIKALWRVLASPGRLLVGLALAYVPIVNIAATGYGIRVLREGSQPASLPRWEGWSRLAVDGLLAWLVTLIYLIPIGIVEAAAASSALEAGSDVLLLLRTAALLAALLLLPAALCAFAARGFWSALRLPSVIRISLSFGYLFVWLLFLALFVALLAVILLGPAFFAYAVPAILFLLWLLTASLFAALEPRA